MFATALAQSGRKAKVVKPSPAPVVEEVAPTPAPTPVDQTPQVTAEKNEAYRCTDDGSLGRILEADKNAEKIFTRKEVDAEALITSQPRASYTREARRAGVQGNVILKVVLGADGRVGPIRIVRRLPAGLTENAIRAACKIKFRPATNGGNPVPQLLQIEYSFRLADPSIFGP
jgi:protein TonB